MFILTDLKTEVVIKGECGNLITFCKHTAAVCIKDRMNLLECSEGLICFLRWSPMVELDRGSFPASFAPMLPLALAFLPLDVS